LHKDSSRNHIQIFSRLHAQTMHEMLHEHSIWDRQLWTQHGELLVSRPACSKTLSFLLSEAQDLILEIDDLGKREECKAELILQNDPTAMTTTDMEFVPLFIPSC
jgi:hypothetical protein